MTGASAAARLTVVSLAAALWASGCGAGTSETAGGSHSDDPGSSVNSHSLDPRSAVLRDLAARYPASEGVVEYTDGGMVVCGEPFDPAELADPAAELVARVAACGCAIPGRTAAIGESWTCDDGCNTCRCAGGDAVTSTTASCEIGIAEVIYFPPGVSTPTSNSLPVLEAVAQVVVQNGLRLRIRGHADTREQNLSQLAIARAEAVRTALVQLGAPREALEVVGLSNTEPLEPAGSDYNRRVNFEVLAP